MATNQLKPLTGGNTEEDKARAVRHMFAAISSRYDFLNHFLSGNVDRYWRWRCLQEIGRRISVPRPCFLDLGCGTADLSILFAGLGEVVGCDFCHPMLQIGRDKVIRSKPAHCVELIEGNALNLPFRYGAFDAVVSAFVVRNLVNLDSGLAEMRRVLRRGGVLGVLDFSMPRVPVFGALYRFYFQRILPKVGKWVSGVDGPYRYLPDSVENFPPPEVLRNRVASAGFQDVACHNLTGGIAVLIVATASG